jgi:hypothetical protein
VLAAIAVPDLSRSTGLAIVEFAIAGAVGDGLAGGDDRHLSPRSGTR